MSSPGSVAELEPFGLVMIKSRLVTISTIAVAVTLLIWAIPVAIGFAQALPLQGSFLLGQCACGHEIFYLIEEAQAFDYCPGHKEKKLVGPVSKNGDLIRISRAKDLAPDFELKLENGGHYLRFLPVKDDEWHYVDQVTNPWRTSLRSYFPE